MRWDPPGVLPACDLLIVLPHLGPGGAQKVALLAADHFMRDGLSVVLVTLLPGRPRTHALPEGLCWIDLGESVAEAWSNRALTARARRFIGTWGRRLAALVFVATTWPWIKQIRPGRQGSLVHWLIASLTGVQASLLREMLLVVKPPRVLSLLTKTNLLCCQALWDSPARLVVSERNDPRLQRLRFPWTLLQGWLWSRADCITANTVGVLEGLKSCFPQHEAAMKPLPNPLVLSSLRESEEALLREGGEGGFLAVCRLVHQKGIDVLIHAYAALPLSIRSEWPLTIAGDGPERSSLEQLVHRLLPVGQVRFLGFQAEPMSLYRSADVFVLPSRFEGMPNALLEAMGFGMAVVVSNASPGPLEVVADGKTGLVVRSEDVQSLANAMERIALDHSLRDQLGQAAQKLMQKQAWPALDGVWRDVLEINH